MALMVYDNDESLKSNSAFEFFTNSNEGLIGDIVPSPVDVIPTNSGKSLMI